MLFGGDAAARMGAAADRESELQPAERAIPTLNGSPTAALLGQAGDQSSGGGHGGALPILLTDALAEAFFNPAGAAVRLGGAAVTKAMQRGIEKMPVGARDLAGSHLLGDPQAMVEVSKANTPAKRAVPAGLFGSGVNAVLGPHLYQSTQ